MFRRVLLAAVLVAVLGASASTVMAADIELWVDVDLTAYLHNTTGADISFDGYQIVSESGSLDPVGWDSISDRFPARLTELLDNLGAGSVAFGELNPSANQVAEGNLTGVGVLKAGAKFSLGKPFLSCPGPGDGFFVKIGGVPQWPDGSSGVLACSEPSSWLLALLGALGPTAIRRRSRARLH